MPPSRSGPAVLLLLASGFLLRLSSWNGVFRDGEIFFIDTDDFYHLRRIMTAAANFPALPTFDYYLGYPEGFHCPWPPFFDWFVGGVTLAAGLGAPTLELSRIIAALAPPLAGTLALALFYAVAREILPFRGAMGALAVAAVLPMPVFYSLLGRPDHHCIETLWVLAGMLSVLRLLGAETERERKRWTAATAAASVLGLLSWVGTFFFSVAMFVFLIHEMMSQAGRGDQPLAAQRWFAAVFLLQVPCLFMSSAGNHWYAEGRIVFDALSPFQPMLMLVLGLWCLCLRQWATRGATTAGVLSCAGALAASGFLLAKSLPGLKSFISTPPVMFKAVSEMQPLLKPFGHWSLENVSAYFGAAFWLLPLLSWLFYVEERSPRRRLILVWTLMTGLLALWQTRYALHLSFPFALLLGFGVQRLGEKLEVIPELKFSGGRRWAGAIAIILTGGILFNALKNVAGLALTDAENLTGSADLLDACRWLRDNTPPTRSLWKDEGPPEYGVYSHAPIGNQVAAIAQRPAAAGNMHTLRRALEVSTAFFFLEGQDAAHDFLRRRGFRYLLLTDIIHDGLLPLFARLEGLRGFDTSVKPDGSLVIPRRILDLIYTRLYVLDGYSSSRGSPRPAALDRFRLVYESHSKPHGTSLYKIFEVVSGARLQGRCGSGALVEAETPVATNQGRSFQFRNSIRCGKSGAYEMRLPYAGRYSVGHNGIRRAIEAPEDLIVSGGILSAHFR